MVAKRTVTGGPLTARRMLEATADDLAGVTEVLASMKEGFGSIQDVVGDWVSACRAELRERMPDVNLAPGDVEGAVADAGLEHPSPEWYFARIINRGTILLALVGKGDASGAANFGYRLGRLIQEHQDAGYEPFVIKAQASRELFKEGAKKRALAAKPRHAAMTEEYEREARRRAYTPTILMEQIGKKHGLHRSQSIKVLRPTEQNIRNRGKSDK
jgi:hypothetical protein